MEKYDTLWQDINTILSYLRHDIAIIDSYYKEYDNDAPGSLYREQINKLQKHLDEA